MLINTFKKIWQSVFLQLFCSCLYQSHLASAFIQTKSSSVSLRFARGSPNYILQLWFLVPPCFCHLVRLRASERILHKCNSSTGLFGILMPDNNRFSRVSCPESIVSNHPFSPRIGQKNLCNWSITEASKRQYFESLTYNPFNMCWHFGQYFHQNDK